MPVAGQASVEPASRQFLTFDTSVTPHYTGAQPPVMKVKIWPSPSAEVSLQQT
jgi:hypothetical protein